jgi:biotin operon repressor
MWEGIEALRLSGIQVFRVEDQVQIPSMRRWAGPV